MPNPRNLIGPQLRKLRDELGLSQPKLAELLQRAGWDISRDILAKIEGQTRWVADFELVFLAKVLKVRFERLLPGRGADAKAEDLVARLERRLS
jgi:transcriptional regulator with XRE-family HTH domain